MTFLLDTNAVSEPNTRRPDSGFMQWWAHTDGLDLSLSVVTLGELKRGALLLSDALARSPVEAYIASVRRMFLTRIMLVDEPIADEWGRISAETRLSGRAVGAPDELIAATATAKNLTVVTRNVKAFRYAGCKLLSPWTG